MTVLPGRARLHPAPAVTGLGSVDLLWLPLGAGGRAGLVRRSGQAYEALAAWRAGRPRAALFHSALEVRVDGVRHVIEMTPVWALPAGDRGVVGVGPVGSPLLGRSRMFRYEVHCWTDGVVPDAAWASGAPRRLSEDDVLARRVLALVPLFPTRTWGRDEQSTGDMWNSNSLTSWLLARSGLDLTGVGPPDHGRAPGWAAGLAIAARDVAGRR